MNLSPLAWQSLTLNHSFSDAQHAVRFFDFQPNAKLAMDQFKRSQFGSLLIVKTELFPEFIHEIEQYLAHDTQAPVISKTEFNKQMYLFFYPEILFLEICSATIFQQFRYKIFTAALFIIAKY